MTTPMITGACNLGCLGEGFPRSMGSEKPGMGVGVDGRCCPGLAVVEVAVARVIGLEAGLSGARVMEGALTSGDEDFVIVGRAFEAIVIIVGLSDGVANGIGASGGSSKGEPSIPVIDSAGAEIIGAIEQGENSDPCQQ
ncbi:MAG: hypothetical protein Q9181_007731 [Wetmoreana brouardii]